MYVFSPISCNVMLMVEVSLPSSCLLALDLGCLLANEGSVYLHWT
jgi:hypothetical protein